MNHETATALSTSTTTEVYLRSTIYCPMVEADCGGNTCAGCEHYAGLRVNAGSVETPPAFFVACEFPG